MRFLQVKDFILVELRFSRKRPAEAILSLKWYIIYTTLIMHKIATFWDSSRNCWKNLPFQLLREKSDSFYDIRENHLPNFLQIMEKRFESNP